MGLNREEYLAHANEEQFSLMSPNFDKAIVAGAIELMSASGQGGHSHPCCIVKLSQFTKQ